MRELRRLGAVYDASDPDLRPFRVGGGKLIIWYGAADAATGVMGCPIITRRCVIPLAGWRRRAASRRMFPVPGVYHCGGGYMPYQLDLLGALINWVEGGVAPDAIEAAAILPGGGVRRRPIFAYPTEAKYRGSGSIDAAASFRRARAGRAGRPL